jgi:hypothetical protein
MSKHIASIHGAEERKKSVACKSSRDEKSPHTLVSLRGTGNRTPRKRESPTKKKKKKKKRASQWESRRSGIVSTVLKKD